MGTLAQWGPLINGYICSLEALAQWGPLLNEDPSPLQLHVGVYSSRRIITSQQLQLFTSDITYSIFIVPFHIGKCDNVDVRQVGTHVF